jgi:hypothetical protein
VLWTNSVRPHGICPIFGKKTIFRRTGALDPPYECMISSDVKRRGC